MSLSIVVPPFAALLLTKQKQSIPMFCFLHRPSHPEGLALPLPSLSALCSKARLQHSPPAWLPHLLSQGPFMVSFKSIANHCITIYKLGGLTLKPGTFASLEKLEDLETFGPCPQVTTTDLGGVTAPASSRALPTASPGCHPQRTGVPWAEAPGQGPGGTAV